MLTDSISDSRDALPPATLKGSPEKKSFNIRGEARTVFEQVASAFGIQVVFEADYQPTAAFLFRLDSVGFADAFRTLELVSNSFVVPVNEHLALVVRDPILKDRFFRRARWIFRDERLDDNRA